MAHEHAREIILRKVAELTDARERKTKEWQQSSQATSVLANEVEDLTDQIDALISACKELEKHNG